MKKSSWFSKGVLLAFVAGTALGSVGTHVRAALSFPDVRSGAYYYDAVGDMSTLGFITGYADGNFGPDDPLTRGQGAVIMHRMWKELEKQGVVDPIGSSNTTRRTRSSSSASSVSTATSSDHGAFRFQTDGFSISESASTATVSVIRTTGKKGAVSVTYKTVAGTAVVGEDFTTTSGVLNFADGETTKTITVSIKNDELGEDAETFTVELSSPTGGATMSTPDTMTVTILDNDGGASSNSSASSTASSAGAQGALEFNAAGYSVMEDSDTVEIHVRRTDGTSGTVTVDYKMTDGTAGGNDYQKTSGTLSFGDGETLKSFTVSLYNNEDTDGNKSVNLSLENITGGAVPGKNSTATLTIVDDEIMSSGTGAFKFKNDNYEMNEGDTVDIEVLRAGGFDGEVTVDYTTNNSSAKEGQDFEKASGTLTFKPGESSKMISVTALADENNENTEAFSVTISNATNGATISTPSTTMIDILD